MKFFPESKSNLTQSTPPPLEMKFFPESKSDRTQNTSPFQIENSNFLSRFQIWPYTEYTPSLKKLKTLIFFPDFKFDFTQNTPHLCPPTPQWRLKYVETNGCIPQGYHLVCSVKYMPMLYRTRLKPQWNWCRFNQFTFRYILSNVTLIVSNSVGS